jgi:uncharacterized protein
MCLIAKLSGIVMRYFQVLALVLLASTATLAQQTEFTTDHTHNLSILGKAKDSLYQQIRSNYDFYLAKNPNDVKGHRERCKFIQNSYYDEYEDYNPKAEEAETCAQTLIANFPDDPESLIFANEFIYGDSSKAYLELLIKKTEENPEPWRNYRWVVYKLQAENYRADDNHANIIRYATLAVGQNDTLDMSVMLATSFKSLNQNDQAIQVLVSHIDSTDDAWVLNQKGKLLLELGASEKALEVLRFGARDSTYKDLGSLAQAMIDNGLIDEAREFLLQNYKESSWEPIKPLKKLLEYDLKYASADSAASTYNRFVENNFWNDGLGVYRWKLFVKYPSLGWTIADIGRVAMLGLFIVLMFIIPYLWILPIHYFGWWRKSKGKEFSASSFPWGLRHFWLACSLWLLCDSLAYIIVDYPGFLSIINDSLATDEILTVSHEAADMMLYFCTGCFIFTTALLKRNDITQFISTFKSNGRAIINGIGLALSLRFGLGLYIQLLKAFGVGISNDASSLASVVDSIVSVNQFYSPYLGFLIVVILVPFYEEILFRGIFLSACERNMKFMIANCLQSLVFAIVHNDLKLIPFYFAFGMVCGHYRQKTEQLLTGTSLHVTNNLIAFIVIKASRG